jgi:hypothetical protein
VAYLKSTGDYVKQGYGIAPKDSATSRHKDSATKIPPQADQHSATSKDSATEIPPHSATFRHKDSATPKESMTYKDSATFPHIPTSEHSPTFPHIPPSQTLTNTKAVQNGPRSGGVVSNGADAGRVDFGQGMKDEPKTAADRSGGLSRMGASTSGSQKEIDEPAPFPLALSGAADEEQQPWGPDENEQAHLEYLEDLALKHKTKEITGLGGAGASHRSVCDGGIDMSAYQQDLDKLLGVLSIERDAWKLGNRQLGKARGEGKISRLELCRGKRNHNELLRVIVDLTADRESGELRYSNLQAAGVTLDIAWTGWRQKMATDPDLIQHYRDTAAQLVREARKEAQEAKRYAAQDRQEEIAATKLQAPAPEAVPEPGSWEELMADAEDNRRTRAPQEDRPSRIARENQERQADADARFGAVSAQLELDMARDAAVAAQKPAETVEEPAPAEDVMPANLNQDQQVRWWLKKGIKLAWDIAEKMHVEQKAVMMNLSRQTTLHSVEEYEEDGLTRWRIAQGWDVFGKITAAPAPKAPVSPVIIEEAQGDDDRSDQWPN